MPLPPLQVEYLKSSDPFAAVVLFIVLGVAVVILVTLNVIKNGIGIGSGLGGGSRGTRFSRFALRRAVASCGLDSRQMAFLESVFRSASISDPVKALANPPLLDRIFKRAYRLIDSDGENGAEAEAKKTLLFSVRTAIASAKGATGTIRTTRQLTEGTAATILGPTGDKYPVKIISAHGERLVVEMPVNALGEPVRIARGAKLAFSFHDSARQGYRFETRVASLTSNALELAHADRLTALPSRKYQRVETNISCYFSAVRILLQTVDRKTVKKTVSDDRRTMGNILDLSAGGCAIKTAATLKAGDYLKVEFDAAHGRTLAAIGRVVRTNRAGSVGGIMHVQFAKVPGRALNVINALVYGYDQD